MMKPTREVTVNLGGNNIRVLPDTAVPTDDPGTVSVLIVDGYDERGNYYQNTRIKIPSLMLPHQIQ